ncbi:MAG: hypothetical protein CSA07_01285 [Bacteroidia bacterium]|nr:MAG: hypothetical protein CSA07_01285 [Bacteroidia bacterium]
MRTTFLGLLALLLPLCPLMAQPPSQRVTGRIFEIGTSRPLPNVSVSLRELQTLSDSLGRFSLQCEAGTHTLHLEHEDYNPVPLELRLTSGKELYVEAEMAPKIYQIEGVTVSAQHRKVGRANFTSATVFNPEEATRYAGSLGDPARMVRSYAGIVPVNDTRNDIVIRGNSPIGLQWKLDGFEIGNPNHYGSIGQTGNRVTLLNTNLLSSSTFLTGAWPAQHGNAASGIFDLTMRDGNSQKFEFLGQTGWNGIEAGAEGPLVKRGKGSFLVDYRYSLLSLLRSLGLDLLDPHYHDLTLKGKLSLGPKHDLRLLTLLGRSSIELLNSKRNKPLELGDADIKTASALYFVGLSETYRPTQRARVETRAAYTRVDYRLDYAEYIPKYGKITQTWRENSYEDRLALSADLHLQLTPRGNLEAGLKFDRYWMRYREHQTDEATDPGKRAVRTNVSDHLNLYRAYTQYQHLLTSRLSLTTGLHGMYLQLNGAKSLEPRAGLKFYITPQQSIALAAGLYAQMLPRNIYFTETKDPTGQASQTNRGLDFMRSQHLNLTYKLALSKGWELKADGYMQWLHGIPVRPDRNFSLLNVGADDHIPKLDSLRNDGLGRNMGIEFTLERRFLDSYYLLLSTTLYRSQFRLTSKHPWRSTAFDGGYILNLSSGYEWKLSSTYALMVDLKTSFAGNRHYGEHFTQKLPPYFRNDLKLSMRVNAPRYHYILAVDLQNLTNHKNVDSRRYNDLLGKYVTTYQQGFLPMVTFSIYF